MLWLSEPTTECPKELLEAHHIARLRTVIDRYRSRTNVAPDHITTAFSWMRLPVLQNETLSEAPRNYVKYYTRAIKRGIEPTTAAQETSDTITNSTRCGYPNIILTFNTATAAAASEAVKNMLDNDTTFEELNVRTMLISSPTHKINVYKKEYDENKYIYVILNNLDTPGVLYKVAAAIMLDQNKFLNDTQQFAEAWMSGNPATIYSLITNYYKEYNENRHKREFENALNQMVTGITETKKRNFEREIASLEENIEYKYKEIHEMMLRLNEAKGNYLLNITINEDQRIIDLQKFLEACKDRITFISAENNRLIIIYRTALIFFEESLLDPYFNSARGNVITNADPWVQQLMKDLFKEKTYTMLIESGVQINLIDRSFGYANVLNFMTMDSMLGIPNPHHKYYNCWGDNTPNIRRALENSDYLTAITTAFAAMSGLNLSDTAVMDKFISDELYNWRTVPCLKNNETKEIITLEEYKRRFRNASNETNE